MSENLQVEHRRWDACDYYTEQPVTNITGSYILYFMNKQILKYQVCYVDMAECYCFGIHE